ncbi:MAG: LamG domain-containing protein [Sedimentisphaeraceae bacterium JB056]
MKCIISLRTLCVSLLVFTPFIFAAYESPLSDDYQTMSLWNMDSTTTLSDGKVIVFDQDDNWGRTNHHLTLYDGDNANGYGATLVSSQSGFGQALQLDGVNDYAKSFIRFPINEGFKLELWIKPDSSKTDINWIAEVPNVWRLYTDTNATRINLYVKDANGDWASNIRKAITPDAWQHITVGFENGTASLSVDGTSQYGTLTLPTTEMYNAGQEDYVWIGSYGGTQRFFKGLIDDVRLTDPAAEVPEWASVHEDAVLGTYALYHMDEITGSIMPDDNSQSSRSPLDLTVYGNPAIVDDGSYPNDDPSFGSSVSFNGMSDYFQCLKPMPYGIDPANFKVEVWIKPNPDWYTVSGGLYWIVGHDSMFRVYLQSDGTVGGARLRYYVWPSDGSGAVLTTIACGALEGWNHISCELYNGVTKIYVNGAEKASTTLPTNDATVGASQMRVGTYNGSSRMFWGQMDELRISNVVIPDPQCGDYGYLESDINKDCVVDILDLKLILVDWLECTTDEAGCVVAF